MIKNKKEKPVYRDQYKDCYLVVRNNGASKNDEDKFTGSALRGTAKNNYGQICDAISGKSVEEVVNKLKKEVDRSLDKNKSPEEAVQEKTTPVSGSEQITSDLSLATPTPSETPLQEMIPEPSVEKTEESVQPLNNSGLSDNPVSGQAIATDPHSEQPSELDQPVNASVQVVETPVSGQVAADPEPLPDKIRYLAEEETAKNSESSSNTKVESVNETTSSVSSEILSKQTTITTDSSEESKPIPKKRASNKKNVYSITTDSEVFPLIQLMIDGQTDLKNEVKRIIEKQTELTKEVNTIKQYMIDLKSNVNFIRGEVSSEGSSQT